MFKFIQFLYRGSHLIVLIVYYVYVDNLVIYYKVYVLLKFLGKKKQLLKFYSFHLNNEVCVYND